MRASYASANHNCSFEQLLKKKINSIYRSVNRYWKKRYNALLDEYNLLNSKLSQLSTITPVELIPMDSAEFAQKDYFPEIVENTDTKTEVASMTIPVIPENTYYNTQDIPEPTDKISEDLLPEPTVLLEPNKESRNSLEFERIEPVTSEPESATYHILKKDKKKKIALVRIKRGNHSHNVEFDYSDEDDFHEQLNDLCKIDHLALMSTFQKFSENSKKRKPKPNPKHNYKKKKK